MSLLNYLLNKYGGTQFDIEQLTKASYFQGGTGKDPEKKPKSKPLNQEDTMARGVLFKNYDLYEVEPSDLGPGAGLFQNMDQYKSVSDFREAKKKRNERKSKSRKAMFACIELQAAKKIKDIKKLPKKPLKDDVDENDLTDPYEGQITPIPFSPAEPNIIGLYDRMIPGDDLEGKPVSNLYYGRTEANYAKDDKAQ
jgi:hypothetical protein